MPYDPTENHRRMAKQTTHEQHRARRRRRLLLRGGQAALLAGAVVGVSHWLAHVGAFGAQPPGWMDLAIGYPTAAVLLIGGAISVGQK